MFVCAVCHCVLPLIFPLLLIPSPLLPRSLSVNESPQPDTDEACHMSLCLPPPETEIVTEFTGHRMHNTSHSIKVDFNGSDLFYSTVNQFTFTLNFLTVHFTFIKLQLSRIWKCNHKRHCFFWWKDFLSWQSSGRTLQILPRHFVRCQLTKSEIK